VNRFIPLGICQEIRLTTTLYLTETMAGLREWLDTRAHQLTSSLRSFVIEAGAVLIPMDLHRDDSNCNHSAGDILMNFHCRIPMRRNESQPRPIGPCRDGRTM
jgi:hypothetical protein